MNSSNNYDVVVIGGGFFGCKIATYLRKYLNKVLILEQENSLLQRASTNNQARVHNGYHYPRSILTARSSHLNFPKFNQEYQDSVVSEFHNYYAIGKKFSKVNARQFQLFCQRVSLPLKLAETTVTSLFNQDLVEQVFKTQEYVFNVDKLTKLLQEELDQKQITCYLDAKVTNLQKIHIHGRQPKIEINYIQANKQELTVVSDRVFNCTYSSLNTILRNSDLPTIPLKHEFTEMALIKVPDALSNFGVTIVCGPFFSIMPFPSRQLHTLSHVRYTPHCYWQDQKNINHCHENILEKFKQQSNYHYMIKDACRYLPILRDSSYLDSIWEIKTVLPQSEINDSRPILFQQNQNLPNLISVLGGKIDNIYDVNEEIAQLFSNQ